jgi:hypothetical protein
MAGRTTITTATVYKALHTEGGPVQQFATNVGRSATGRARAKSPVDSFMNAGTRWGEVGVYKASWYSKRTWGNQHASRIEVGNRANHAIFVEEGRRASWHRQTFTWQYGPARRKYPWMYVGPGRRFKMTRARPGKHILRDSMDYALAKYGIVSR